MEHLYYGIWDSVAKCYAWVGENKSNATFARMCNVMAKDDKTFIGQAPGDYIGYKLAAFNDETGEFINDKEKAWESKPNDKKYEEGREPFFSESGEKFRKQYIWTKNEKGEKELKETESIDIQQEIESYADECDIKNIVRKASFDPQFLKSLSQGALEGTEVDITEFPQNIHEYHRMMATAQAKMLEIQQNAQTKKVDQNGPIVKNDEDEETKR